MDLLFLSNTVLFGGVSVEELESMLGCLGVRVETYKKGDCIYRIGEQVESIGMVLSGLVYIENDDIWGNKSILDYVAPGQVFAETYACVPEEPLLINVVAAETTEVLFLNTKRVLQTCSSCCSHHSKLVRNLLSISAHKNLNLSRKILHTSSKGIRGRVEAYLSHEVRRQGSTEIIVPFNRQQLADYLGVDRSALSNELSKMKKEGVLDYEKNKFTIVDLF